MRRTSVPRLLVYLLGVTLLVGLVVAASTSTAAFGTYNLEWDGTSEFRAIADADSESTVTLDTEPYTTIQPNGTLAVVLAPAEPYTSNDSARVRAFVEDGGTLLVADNFGPTETVSPYGNDLLADVGATARLDGAPLRDERSYYRSPALPVADNVSDHPYTAGVDELTLNHGTAVEPNDAEPLVWSSEFAYLDRDRTEELSDDEELASYPVVTVERVGDGQVITVGDPSLFINAMLERDGNAAFAAALVGSHERTLLDYAYSGDQPPLSVALLALRGSIPLQLFVGLLGVGLTWTAVMRPGICRGSMRRLIARLPDGIASRIGVVDDPDGHADADGSGPAVSEDELVAYLRRRHPDWETERVRRVIAGVIREEDRQGDDE